MTKTYISNDIKQASGHGLVIWKHFSDGNQREWAVTLLGANSEFGNNALLACCSLPWRQTEEAQRHLHLVDKLQNGTEAWKIKQQHIFTLDQVFSIWCSNKNKHYAV